jgi:outer membrane translocation and assembly module TamA
VWGDAPWFDLAYIGGAENLRGWPTQRFAGDASLYGGGELRLDLFDYRLLLPSSFGILGLFDLGRVWLDGDSPGGFHIGYGGGIWIAIRGTRSVLSFALATSDEETGLYVSMGFAF